MPTAAKQEAFYRGKRKHRGTVAPERIKQLLATNYALKQRIRDLESPDTPALRLAYETRLSALRKVLPNWDEAVQHVDAALLAKSEAVLFRVPNGPECLYAIASNPAIAEQLRHDSALEAERRLWYLSVDLMALARQMSQQQVTNFPPRGRLSQRLGIVEEK